MLSSKRKKKHKKEKAKKKKKKHSSSESVGVLLVTHNNNSIYSIFLFSWCLCNVAGIHFKTILNETVFSALFVIQEVEGE